MCTRVAPQQPQLSDVTHFKSTSSRQWHPHTHTRMRTNPICIVSYDDIVIECATHSTRPPPTYQSNWLWFGVYKYICDANICVHWQSKRAAIQKLLCPVRRRLDKQEQELVRQRISVTIVTYDSPVRTERQLRLSNATNSIHCSVWFQRFDWYHRVR